MSSGLQDADQGRGRPLAPAQGLLTMKPWSVIAAAVLLPGPGQVLLGRPMRGLLLLFRTVIFGAITYHLLTDATTSRVGRFSGGYAVWVLSVVEVTRMACRR